MTTPKLLLVLSENWAITPPDDMRALVRIAVEAEQAGIDGVMLSEHIVLGPSAGAAGVMANPRDYAYPGNQPSDMSWPNSIVLFSAIAAVTERLRLVAGALIAPLRHPLLLAKELATLDLLSQGRLVVLPTVSWHEEEYEALGVPFAERGRILDEQLEILARCWQPGPVSYQGRYFSFPDVWVEPRPYRPGGPVLWFGGRRMHGPLLRRLVRWGQGFNPLGTPTQADLDVLRAGLSPQAGILLRWRWSAASGGALRTRRAPPTSTRRWRACPPSSPPASPRSVSSPPCTSTTHGTSAPCAAPSCARWRRSRRDGHESEGPAFFLTGNRRTSVGPYPSGVLTAGPVEAIVRATRLAPYEKKSA